MSDIRVTQVNPLDSVATGLIAELSSELAKIYPDSHGGDGSGAFKPQDVMVPRAAFVVAWLDDEAVGCGALRPMDEADTVEVKRMFVRSAMRGKGISRTILNTLEDIARDFDYRVAKLETGTRQIEAIGLYESSGYERTDCYGEYTDEALSVCYKKSL